MYFYILTIQPQILHRVMLAIFVAILIPGHAHISQRAYWYTDGKRAWVRCYRQTEDIAYCDSATNFKIYPAAERTHLKEKLDYLKRNRLNLFAE